MTQIVIAKCIFCKTSQEVMWGKLGAQSYECIKCKAAGMYLQKVGA